MAITNYELKIKKRIQLVHIAAAELGLLDPKRHNTDPDDEYHIVLARWHRPGTRQPVTSSTQMSCQQLGELLDFMKALGFKLRPRTGLPQRGTRGKATERIPQAHNASTWRKYDSSMQGLKNELCDLARARFGDSWEAPLNSLCQRFGVKRWQWLDVAHGKELKAVILRMNAADKARAEAVSRGGAEVAEKDEIPF